MFRMLLTAAVVALPARAAAAAAAASPATEAPPPLYMNPAAPIYERVEDLLSKMTLTEKIVQTYAPYGAFDVESFGATSVGMMSINPATRSDGTPEQLVAARNKIQDTLVKGSRLHIPGSFSQEALHSGTRGGTVFPELVTQGSSWDPELIENISAAVAAEARWTGVDVAFSPVLNQWVDSRFGRLQEGYSENPTLTAAYAVAAANGFQGPQPAGKWAPMAQDKVVALGKHYAAYGAAVGGLNGAPAELSERTLREFFLKSWKAFAKAGGKGAMTAHNTVLDRPCHAHPWLVNTVFRDEFSFGDGIIVSVRWRNPNGHFSEAVPISFEQKRPFVKTGSGRRTSRRTLVLCRQKVGAFFVRFCSSCMHAQDCNDIEALIDFRVAKDIPGAAAAALEGGVDLDLQCGPSSAYTSLADAIEQKLVNETTVGARHYMTRHHYISHDVTQYRL
jgi:beta-glucosidase-like glycosyl hydrolase